MTEPVYDQQDADNYHLATENRNLRKALEESVKLQAHYAELLNMHDGGKRMIFPTVDAWIERLKKTGVIND